MRRLICLEDVDYLAKHIDSTHHNTPRHIELNLPNCCEESIYRFMYAFFDATEEERSVVLLFGGERKVFSEIGGNRRTFFRKQRLLREKFIATDTPKCCLETIDRFLNTFQAYNRKERELIIHIIKKRTLTAFRLCCRRTAQRWVQKIISQNPELTFLRTVLSSEERDRDY